MAAEIDGEKKGYSFQWRIENVSQSRWLKQGESICSPSFFADALENTKWSLCLYPMGNGNENGVDIYLHREKNCSGPDVIEVSSHFAFLDKYGSILFEGLAKCAKFSKGQNHGLPDFEKREKIFFTNRKKFLPEDTLTIECSIWDIMEKPVKWIHEFAFTELKVKRRSFVWTIEKISTLELGIKNSFNDNLFDFDVFLQEDLKSLKIDITSFEENLLYMSCNTLIVEPGGKWKTWSTSEYFATDLKEEVLPSILLLYSELLGNKSRYFFNDTFWLIFEFFLLTIEDNCFGKNVAKLQNGIDEIEKSFENTVGLKDALESMYIDGVLSDMELRTSSKSFPTHKCILSVRSPVFKSMFSHDMTEKNSGHVNITDFEDDTIHLMLLYIYTDTLNLRFSGSLDLQFQSASELYKIADKYEIMCLKSKCSSFLKDNLIPTNACDALVLADLHNDNDLKSSVASYIVGNKDVFYTRQWKNFMSTYPEIAADLMYRKITKNRGNNWVAFVYDN